MVNQKWLSLSWTTVTLSALLSCVLAQEPLSGRSLTFQPHSPTEIESEYDDNLPLVLRYDVSKRQAFHPWGGKRSSPSYYTPYDGFPVALRRAYLALFKSATPKIPSSDKELKRASFSPWGGKRSDPSISRIDLHDISLRPWGGKQAQNQMNYDEDFENPYSFLPNLSDIDAHGMDNDQERFVNEPSRSFDTDDMLLNKDISRYFPVESSLHLSTHIPGRFKREITSVDIEEPITSEIEDSVIDDQSPYRHEQKRTKFSAWAGKRPDLNLIREVVRSWAKKPQKVPDRRAFSAWAGKRSIHYNPSEPQDKRAFNAWAGKRSQEAKQITLSNKTISYTKDLDHTLSEDTKKEKEILLADSKISPHTQIPPESNMSKENLEKRSAFNAWAGKRANGFHERNSFNTGDEQQSDEIEKRQAFNAWAGKRSQGFSAWAGKRGNDLEKRQGFSAWAGKRGEDPEKRQGFSAWAGKRGDDYDERQSFSAWAGKRQGFSAWAGKRDENTWLDTDMSKRQSFNAWAGKRSDNSEKRESFNAWAGKRDGIVDKRQAFNAWAGKRASEIEKKQSFNAWAGKRADDLDKRQSFNAWAGKRNGDLDKRQAFNAWAGKRANDLDKRQSFSAWAGKRNGDFDKRQSFSAWAGKRGGDQDKRQGFSAWAGKRDAELEKRQGFSAWAGKRDTDLQKRQAFNAWAGKRSAPTSQRHPFSAWAGKRTQNDDEQQADLLQEDMPETYRNLQNSNPIYDEPLRKTNLPLSDWSSNQATNTWQNTNSELLSSHDNSHDQTLPIL